MSKAQVTDFLIELSENQERLNQFEADPIGTVTSAGFTKEEIDVLISRDPDVLRRYLAADGDSSIPPDFKKQEEPPPDFKRKKKPAKKPTPKKPTRPGGKPKKK
jgi:hypothetical protein